MTSRQRPSIGERFSSFGYMPSFSSKRARNNKISVIKKFCDKCGHHKSFVKNSKTTCSKCKR